MISKQQTKEWNKRFRSLSKAEKRVAIAQDVLAQIKARKVTPTSGRYIDVNFDPIGGEEPENWWEIDAQENFDGIKYESCALGSMILCMVKFTDDATVEDLNDERDFLFERLEKYFTKEQIFMIEHLFELWTVDSYWVDYLGEWNKLFLPSGLQGRSGNNGFKPSQDLIELLEETVTKNSWTKKTEEQRLVWLMKNIVKNNGDLVL